MSLSWRSLLSPQLSTGSPWLSGSKCLFAAIITAIRNFDLVLCWREELPVTVAWVSTFYSERVVTAPVSQLSVARRRFAVELKGLLAEGVHKGEAGT